MGSPERVVRVLVADDHRLFAEALSVILEGEPGVECVGVAGDGREAIKKARELQPDVVLMDIAMKGITGLEAAAQMRERYPEVRVVILSMHSGEEYVLQALRADPVTAAIRVLALSADARPEERERGLRGGFAAYLTKPVVFAELVAALQRLVAVERPG